MISRNKELPVQSGQGPCPLPDFFCIP